MMPLERLLSFTFPLQRGADVRAAQQALRRAGHSPGDADGVFGPDTREAVLRFQRAHSLGADGIVGPRTWARLQAQAPALVPPADWRAIIAPLLPRLTSLHGAPVGQGTRRWRLTPGGVEVDGALPRSQGGVAAQAWARHGEAMQRAAREHGVPVELLLATACTESAGRAEAVREEPGFLDDRTTPHRVSPGMMQTLISTAREALADPRLDRAALLRPEVSLAAGAAYIRRQALRGRSPTAFDPPLVAVAYNAGSLRPADNPWGMVQTRRGDGWHADALTRFLNDGVALLRATPVDAATPSFTGLLAA